MFALSLRLYRGKYARERKKKTFFCEKSVCEKKGERRGRTRVFHSNHFLHPRKEALEGRRGGAEYAIFSVNLFARTKYRPRRENREKENIGREESPGLVISRIFDSQQTRLLLLLCPYIFERFCLFPPGFIFFCHPRTPVVFCLPFPLIYCSVSSYARLL